MSKSVDGAVADSQLVDTPTPATFFSSVSPLELPLSSRFNHRIFSLILPSADRSFRESLSTQREPHANRQLANPQRRSSFFDSAFRIGLARLTKRGGCGFV